MIALIKLLAAIPGLVKLAMFLERKWNEVQAQKRQSGKDASVDAAVDSVINGMHPPEAKQQSEIDREK